MKNIEDKIEPKGIDSKNSLSDVTRDSVFAYEGSWFWKSKDSSSTFKIILLQREDTIYGKYCAAYDFGNRMDCDFDTTLFNLQGLLNQDSILLKFNSFYGAENGIAFIQRKGDSLFWRILKYPQGGDCFAPKDVVMFKKIKNW